MSITSQIHFQHFADAALTALDYARKFRDQSLSRAGGDRVRRMDRTFMRGFAIEHRKYVARARQYTQPEGTR